MATANPLLPTALEDLVHVGNPSKHVSVPAATDVDITSSAYLGQAACGLYVGGAGNVTLIDRYGTACTYTAVPAGTYLSMIFTNITGASTTATGMIAVGK